MFFKRLVSVSLSFILCSSMVQTVMAEDPSKGISLGLSLATAMADEKDVAKGLTKVVNDETSEWLWSLIGGSDALFNEQINDISAVKGKIDEVVGIIGSIEKISYAMGEGKFDVAAIEALDKVVGKVNHPLVTLTWSAAKMTYESHLLVQSTGAAVQVEVLYSIVNRDRRMMGTIDPGSDAPPTVKMDKSATEYFFNKYVITDGGAREALKSYVTTVLGEKWPEQSWSDWLGSFKAIGSGVDTAKNAELEMLDNEWRDKGSSWVRRAMQDVNKQAKAEWARVRLSQAQAEFKAFSDRVGHFYNGDFEQMLKEFLSIKQYQKELPLYKEALVKSQQERSKVADKISALKSKDLKDVGGLQPVINSWAAQVYSYSMRADMIREKSLAALLLSERQAWKKLSERVDAFIGNQEGSVVASVKSDTQANEVRGISTGYATDSQVASYRSQYLDELMSKYDLKEYQWDISLGDAEVLDAQGQKIEISSEVEDLKSALLEQCNQLNINIARQMVLIWLKAAKKYFEEWSETLDPVYGEIPELESYLVAKESAQQAIDGAKAARLSFGKAGDALRSSLPNCWGGSWREFYACEGKNKKTMIDYYEGGKSLYEAVEEKQKKLGLIIWGWSEARVQLLEVAKRMAVVAKHTYAKNIEGIGDIPDAFESLAAIRKAQYDKFVPVLDQMLSIGTFDGLEKSLGEDFKKASQNTYTFFTPFKDGNPQIFYLPALLEAKANNLMMNGLHSSSAAYQIEYYEKKMKVWATIIEFWEKTEKLDEEDIRQINIFLKIDRDLAKDIALANEIASQTPDMGNLLISHHRKMLNLAEQDESNRSQDSGWLLENARSIQRMLNELVQNGWMQKGNQGELEVVLPGNIEEGMVLTNTPYRHYMNKQELDALMTPIMTYIQSSKEASFINKYAPDHYRKLLNIVSLSDVEPSRGDNFFVRNEVVYVEDVLKAEKVIESMKSDDKDFSTKMAQIAILLPLTLNAATDKEMEYHQKQAQLYKLPLEEYFEKVLRKTPSKEDYSFRTMDLNGSDLDQHEGGQKYLELRESLKVFFDERRGANVIAEQEARRAVQEEEIALRLKEERLQAEAEGQRMLDNMEGYELAGYYGYFMEDARLNSQSMRSARGDVILTNQDLQMGRLNISMRMSTTDKMKTVLVSEDGGRTWKELNLAKTMEFGVDPLPGKVYDFVLKIKTTDQRDVMMKVFAGVNSITYQDIDFTQLVAQTVKEIAEAYERQDISAFSDLISRDYFGNKAILEEGARFDFDLFSSIRLKIYINRIAQQGNTFIAETKWDKSQNPRTTGQEQLTSGRTTFMFVIEDGKMKIKNLRGDLIYATLSPQIAQASGKNSAVVDQIRTAQEERNPTQPGAGDTEDAGGVTTSGGSGGYAQTLTVQTAVITSSPGMNRTEYIDFEIGITGLGQHGDINFGGEVFRATVAADIDQRTSGLAYFNALDTVPGDFADDGSHDGTAVIGNVFVILTDQGNYVKMYISNVYQYADPDLPVEQDYFDVTIKYAVSDDGKNLKTQ